MKKCSKCLVEKELKSFGFNSKNGKKYNRSSTCYKCKNLLRKKKIKPLFISKYDPRFKWSSATYSDKIRHWTLVYESNIKKKDGCWEWIGHIDKDGYGFMTYEKKSMRGHRVSWTLHKGPIPKGMMVLHACDNPPCTNPEHLFLGTSKDNYLDMIKKGRKVFKKGSQCSFSKLTELKVKNIKKLIETGMSQYLIAKKYNISRGVICDIKRGKTWKHVK